MKNIKQQKKKKYKTLWDRIKAKFQSREWEHLYANQYVVSCYDEIVAFGWQCYRLGKMEGKKEMEKDIFSGKYSTDYIKKHSLI